MMLSTLQQDTVKKLLASQGVTFAALFGSQAKGLASDQSDVDILVKFQKDKTPSFFQLFDFEEKLKNLIGKKIDLVSINALSPYIKDEVMQTCQVFYEK
jgi:predicted nucleotidyltransferase